MAAPSNRQWLLARRPAGPMIAADLVSARAPVPQPGEGEVLVRVKLLCMDPTIRNFLDEDPGYGLPVAIGGQIRGMAVGEVVRSRSPLLAEGALVWGFGAWSDYVTGPASRFFPLPAHYGYALPVYAHAMGTIGLTACHGMFDIAALRPGDNVLVSGAAGAVGSLAGQFARLGGAARVVGIAGGPDKCARAVRDYGYDLCLDYRRPEQLAAAIGAAFPDGIDVVFENIGGTLLDAALGHLRKHARVALCGMMSRYGQGAAAPGSDALWNLVVNSARIEGFLVSNILHNHSRTGAMLARIDGWIKSGALRYDIDVRHGFEQVPASFDCLFSGRHTGRLVVQLDDPD
ncbi:NADP-dependent oxidoreductase [Duganella sp. LjRoot269]|jgi:NADPH-dependent curcumin reductase CurA|uniref:NADP-dependent oxidoreductase n=1 Tax=Duganella sp. LjRoot269 TaxID=3342305 RepID=UPI003ED115A4